MLAFLIAQQSWRNGGDAFDDICPALLSVAGHPFIEYQVKNLAGIGVKKLRITGGSNTSKIEKILGNGKRWGIDISYIVCAEGKSWEEIFVLNKSFFTESSAYLLIRGNVFFPKNIMIGGDSGILFSVSLDDFLSICSSSSGALYLPPDEMKNILKVGFVKNLIENVHAFVADTHASMLKMNDLILSIDDKWGKPDFPRSFNQVYVAGTAKIHPQSQLSSACVIGEKCRIEADVVIKGNVAIGDGCIIDKGAVITESIIDANTYIGKFAVVDSSIISGHRIYSRETDDCTYVADGFWVDSLKEKNTEFSEEVSFGERLTAVFLWLMAWPVMLLSGCRRKKYRALYATVGVSDTEGHIKPGEITYKMDKTLSPAKAVLSALPEVIAGKMHFCGRVPLSPDQHYLIPPDFLEIYLAARPGLVTLADNLSCENSFQRRINDIYLCGSLGFIKRLLLFLESYRILKRGQFAAGFISEAGFNKLNRKKVEK